LFHASQTICQVGIPDRETAGRLVAERGRWVRLLQRDAIESVTGMDGFEEVMGVVKDAEAGYWEANFWRM